MIWQRKSSGVGPQSSCRAAALAILLGTASTVALPVAPALAQSYSFSQVRVEGNDQIDADSVVGLARIPRGGTLSAAGLNDAYQRIIASGLFESVELVPSGGTLVIRVVEQPTINVVSFEGNNKIKDEQLAEMVRSQSRRVFSPTQAERDAEAITKAYSDIGRLAARVEPRIIRRDGNRVDLVFEIREGRVTEVERLSST